MTLEELAENLYHHYCTAVGGKAFNGDALPSWKDFSEDPKKKLQADGWRSLALYVSNMGPLLRVTPVESFSKLTL